jgi:hypothetical protein
VLQRGVHTHSTRMCVHVRIVRVYELERETAQQLPLSRPTPAPETCIARAQKREREFSLLGIFHNGGEE